MEKINPIPFGRIPIEVESVDDYSKPIQIEGTGTPARYAKNIYYYIPESLIELIRKLILNQNEIIEKLNLILESRIGKSIINLEKGIENEKQV